MLNKEKISISFLNQVCISSLFKQDLVKYLLNNNFWIAGGFARFLHSLYRECDQREVYDSSKIETKIQKYLNIDGGDCGDIDFFTTKENYKKWKDNNRFRNKIHDSDVTNINNVFKGCHRRSSKKRKHFTPWITYLSEFADNYEHDKIKVQVVNSFFYQTIDECFESFDFTNCRYSIYKEGKELYFLYDRHAVKYDEEKLLDVRNSVSLMLAHRILRYLKYRDLQDMTERSFKNIDNYIYKIACNYWNENSSSLYEKLHIHAIGRLNKRYPLTKEMLSILALSLKTLTYGENWIVKSLAHDTSNSTKLIVENHVI